MVSLLLCFTSFRIVRSSLADGSCWCPSALSRTRVQNSTLRFYLCVRLCVKKRRFFRASNDNINKKKRDEEKNDEWNVCAVNRQRVFSSSPFCAPCSRFFPSGGVGLGICLFLRCSILFTHCEFTSCTPRRRNGKYGMNPTRYTYVRLASDRQWALSMRRRQWKKSNDTLTHNVTLSLSLYLFGHPPCT